MAQVMKKRSLVNSGSRRKRMRGIRYPVGRVSKLPARPGPKRKRKNSSRKRMTAKQIKYFGTARQRAALRASGIRRRNSGKRKRNYGTRLGRSWSSATAEGRSAGAKVGRFRAAKREGTYRRKPGSRRRRHNSGRARTRRKNVGQIFSIGLAGLAGGNPGTRRKKRIHKKRSVTTMAARRRRRTRRTANAGHRTYRRRRRTRAVANHRTYRRRRRNSGVSYRRRRSYNRGYRHSSQRRRSRNPGFGGAVGTSTNLLKNALGVIGGAVATRYATQLALGGKNTGAIGYLGNAVAALVLGWAAKKWMGPAVGGMVMLGGFTGLALRLLSDLTPIGQYVNLSLSGAGKAGDTGIGLITDTTFYVPTVFNSGSMTDAMIPNQIRQLVAAGSVGKSGMGAMRRRRMAA